MRDFVRVCVCVCVAVRVSRVSVRVCVCYNDATVNRARKIYIYDCTMHFE